MTHPKICLSCGGKTPSPKITTCSDCLDRQRDPGASPFDDEPPLRPNSSRKPYRLAPACDLRIAEQVLSDRRQRQVAIEHFKSCLDCQRHDRFYYSLDAADPRFLDWCNLLWAHNGPLDPEAIYEVVRFDQEPPTFREWRKSYVGPEAEAVGPYMAERAALPRTTTYESGQALWDNPAGIDRSTKCRL